MIGRTITASMAKKNKLDEPTEQSRANRLTIPLNSDNSIDWDSVRPNQREQILEMANNDVTILEHIGMSNESSGSGEGSESEEEGGITKSNVGAFFDMLCKTNAFAFGMIIPKVAPPNQIRSKAAGRPVPMTIDQDILLHSFMLTEEQHAEIDPRGLRLAKKYIPAEKSKHLDLWLLIGMFLKFQVDNGQKAMMLQLQRDMKMMQASQSPPLDSDRPPQAPVPPPTVPPEPVQDGGEGEGGGESLEPGFVPEHDSVV